MRQAPIVIAVYATLAITLGGQWIAAKLGVTAVPALELSTMRFAISAAVLVVACAITRTPIPLQRWRPITAAAVCGVLGFNTLAFVGLSLTPASDSALIIPTTIPLATALFATLIHERLTSRKLFGFAVASLGAALVIVGGQQGGSESSASRVAGGRIPRRVLDRGRVRPVLLGRPSLRREPRGDGDLPHADRDPRARVPDPGRAPAAVAAGRWSGDRRRRAPGGASVTRGARPGTGDDLSERRSDRRDLLRVLLVASRVHRLLVAHALTFSQ